MNEPFPESKSLRGRVKVELGLRNYATKTVLINATGSDTSSFAKKVDLANLKSDVDKLDIDKLIPVPVDLSELSNVVKYDVVRKDVYNAKIKNIEDKIPGSTNLGTEITLNTKINEVKCEIPNITNLATKMLLMLLKTKYLVLVI